MWDLYPISTYHPLNRVLRLENGLVALLIEDHIGQDRARKKSSSVSAMRSSGDESGSNGGAEESEEDGDCGDDDVGVAGDGGGAHSDTEGGGAAGGTRGEGVSEVDGVKLRVKEKASETQDAQLDCEDMSVSKTMCRLLVTVLE